MVYKCAFDFTIVKPKTSQFIDKSGVVELSTEKPLSNEEIENLKTNKNLLHNIAFDLNENLKQKNIFDIKIKSITPA